ncbi:hypothetical protein BDV19DRAFT_11147 [Aspergillus venezuelensis]
MVRATPTKLNHCISGLAPEHYSLSEVLAIARIHPFYNENIQYPPDASAIQTTLSNLTSYDLLAQPLLEKKSIRKATERLVQDLSPQNTYRQASYLSISGSGSSSTPSYSPSTCTKTGSNGSSTEASSEHAASSPAATGSCPCIQPGPSTDRWT